MVAWITVIHQLGGALRRLFGGVLRISFGSYLEAFLLAGLLVHRCCGDGAVIGVGRQGAQPEKAI